MNLLSRISVVICCFFFSFGYVGLSRGGDWKPYYQAEVEKENKTVMQKLYFDESSIERPQKGIVKVTQKVTQVASNETETDIKMWLVEMNCSSRKYRYLSVTEYEEGSGKVVVESRTDNNATWVSFSLDSVIGSLYDNVCFEKKQPKQTEKKPDKQPEKAPAK